MIDLLWVPILGILLGIGFLAVTLALEFVWWLVRSLVDR